MLGESDKETPAAAAEPPSASAAARMSKALPALSRLTELEARSIELMFRLYDYKSTGRIPSHLAKNLFRELGIDVAPHMLPPQGTLKDLLLVADQRMPDPLPALPGALQTFVSLVGREPEVVVEDGEGAGAAEGQATTKKAQPPLEPGKRVTTDGINAFVLSLGRPPIGKIEAEVMLNSMLDYDDCQKTPAVPVSAFASDMNVWARKSNAVKDL